MEESDMKTSRELEQEKFDRKQSRLDLIWAVIIIGILTILLYVIN